MHFVFLLKPYTQYHEYLYNALSVVYQTIADVIALNYSISNGNAFVKSASNLTFHAMYDDITTNVYGDIPIYFSLWDFDPGLNGFVMALEATNDTSQFFSNPDVEIQWPAGVMPAPDVCAFTTCHEYGITRHTFAHQLSTTSL